MTEYQPILLEPRQREIPLGVDALRRAPVIDIGDIGRVPRGFFEEVGFGDLRGVVFRSGNLRKIMAVRSAGVVALPDQRRHGSGWERSRLAGYDIYGEGNWLPFGTSLAVTNAWDKASCDSDQLPPGLGCWGNDTTAFIPWNDANIHTHSRTYIDTSRQAKTRAAKLNQSQYKSDLDVWVENGNIILSDGYDKMRGVLFLTRYRLDQKTRAEAVELLTNGEGEDLPLGFDFGEEGRGELVDCYLALAAHQMLKEPYYQLFRLSGEEASIRELAHGLAPPTLEAVRAVMQTNPPEYPQVYRLQTNGKTYQYPFIGGHLLVDLITYLHDHGLASIEDFGDKVNTFPGFNPGLWLYRVLANPGFDRHTEVQGYPSHNFDLYRSRFEAPVFDGSTWIIPVVADMSPDNPLAIALAKLEQLDEKG